LWGVLHAGLLRVMLVLYSTSLLLVMLHPR
jgi:hypothetical protein